MPTHPTIVHGDAPDVSARSFRLVIGVPLPDVGRAECVEEDAQAVVEFLLHLPGETLGAVARMLQECELADQVEVSE